MAREFLKWLDPPQSLSWLDIGCGTGALSEAILQNCKPAHLDCIDPSEKFLTKTKERLKGSCGCFISSADDLPFENQTVDLVVSGLALNFFPNPEKALLEMKRVSRDGGRIGAYVWDYSGRMDFLRYFWNAAVLLAPQSSKLDEGIRFPICRSDALKETFLSAGLFEVRVAELDVVTHFRDFNDFWDPFYSGQGPAPGYLASLSNDLQNKLKNMIYKTLPFEPDRSIKMLARAIAVCGKV